MGLGVEQITDVNNRSFTGGSAEDWLLLADGAGTLGYNTDVIGGDDKQILLTANGDTNLYAYLSTGDFGGSFPQYGVAVLAADLYVPAGNTLKDIFIVSGSITGEVTVIPLTLATLIGDTWTRISIGIKFSTDIAGTISIGFSGAPTNGDKLYIDNVSIKQMISPCLGRMGNTLNMG